MANAFYNKALEKMLSTTGTLAITNATNASPIVITTSVPHGLATADVVTIRGVGGNTAANVNDNAITVTGASTFSLNGTTGNGAYTASTGEVLLTSTLLKKSTHIIRWAADDIKVVLVDVDPSTGYTFSAAHEFLSSILVADRIATSANLSGKTFAAGVADANDVTFSAVPSSNTVEAFVVYKDSGDAASSSLIAYFDTSTGLPVTTNGGDITIAWDNSGNGIFKI